MGKSKRAHPSTIEDGPQSIETSELQAPSPRQRAQLTPGEDVTLDLVRHVCALYSTNDARHWDGAMARAERAAGPEVGAFLVVRVTALVRTLAGESVRSFHFHAPGCAGLSADEHDAISLLRAAANGERLAILSAIRNLCPSVAPQPVAEAAGCLAALLHLVGRQNATPCAPADSLTDPSSQYKLH